MGEEGGRRRKKGAGLQFSGLPPTSPGEAGTSPGSRRPRTGHRGRTEPPSPASPLLQEGRGGAATPFGVGERSFFAQVLYVTRSPRFLTRSM